MSDIRKGDLVMVVRDCCGHYLGRVFAVGGFQETPRLVECSFCKALLNRGPYVTNADWVDDGRTVYWMPPNWLKRIPPIEELDRDEIVRELTA